MEALATYDFSAQHDDELSFKKGDILKILNMDDDKNWYKAEKEGLEGYVPVNYINMRLCPWYLKECTRLEAEQILLNTTYDGQRHIQKDGAFIVRRSETSVGDFSLSVKCGEKVQHFKVLRDTGGKYFLWVMKFNSIQELLEYHTQSPVSRNGDIKLMRFFEVTARFDFTSNDSEELNFAKNDRILVLQQLDANWWKGKSFDRDDIGLFPTTYVEPSPERENPLD